jgi:uncharacterized membrane protein YfcA
VIPTTATLYLFMGLVPFLVWLPDRWVKLDAQRPAQALICGLSVTGVNLTAGVAGPFLDIFFVRTALTRHQIVATKAASQVFSHTMKIIVYGAPLLAVQGKGMPPLWVFALAIPLSMVGTAAGGVLLNRLSDINFKRYLRAILTGHRARLPGPGRAALPAGLGQKKGRVRRPGLEVIGRKRPGMGTAEICHLARLQAASQVF